MVTLADLATDAGACTRCPLAAGRTTVVFGVGDPDADLMLVGEAPGAEEDVAGEPFVGRSGRLLDRLLAEEVGLDRSRVYIANTVMCRPPANRDPRPGEIAACRPYLDAKIELIGPRVIVTLGNFATRLLLGTDGNIGSLRGRAYRFGPAVVIPTYHPSYVLRAGSAGEPMAGIRADLVRVKEYLAAVPPPTGIAR
ncbi:MAG: uracil-DNA glycosylase [Acidimicrobiales bacterium]